MLDPTAHAIRAALVSDSLAVLRLAARGPEPSARDRLRAALMPSLGASVRATGR